MSIDTGLSLLLASLAMAVFFLLMHISRMLVYIKYKETSLFLQGDQLDEVRSHSNGLILIQSLL